MNNQNSPGEYEVCILCGKKTPVKFDTDISERVGYISGVGQLCMKCYLEYKEEYLEHDGRREVSE